MSKPPGWERERIVALLHELQDIYDEMGPPSLAGEEWWFEGLEQYVKMPEHSGYVIHRVPNIREWAYYLSRAPVLGFTDPYVDVSEDVQLSGAFLFRNPISLGFEQDEDGEILNPIGETHQYWIFYQEENPSFEKFYVGTQEGNVLRDLGRVKLLSDLWSNHPIQPVRIKELDSADWPVRLQRVRFRGEEVSVNPAIVFNNLCGLYSVFLIEEPSAIVPLISPGNDTPEFVLALSVVGYTGPYAPSDP